MYAATIEDTKLGAWPRLNPADFRDLCRTYGARLISKTLDPAKLLWALGGNESSFGYDCVPRHEMAYCTGRYADNRDVDTLTTLYGHSAHCSYGPWQILLVNCTPGTKPDSMRDAKRCAEETMRFMLEQADAQKPTSIREWGQLWNGGYVGAENPLVNAYCFKLLGNYVEAPL